MHLDLKKSIFYHYYEKGHALPILHAKSFSPKRIFHLEGGSLLIEPAWIFTGAHQ